MAPHQSDASTSTSSPAPSPKSNARIAYWENSQYIMLSHRRLIYFVGGPTLLIGICLIIAAIHSSLTLRGDGGDLVFALSIAGLLCFLIGLWMTFGRRGISLDKREGVLKIWWGFHKVPLFDTIYPLTAVRGVEIKEKAIKPTTIKAPSSSLTSSSVYSTVLMGDIMLVVNIHTDQATAKKEAKDLSHFVTIDKQPPILV